MKVVTLLLYGVLIAACARSQDSQPEPRLIGRCEGCEAVLEYGDRVLSPVDTLPGFNDPGPQILISGTVYMPDGKTPAKDVIIYVYHTDQGGIYPKKGDETGWARRHGYLRGWMKTGKDGTYSFYTLKPGVYPSRVAPAHIHITILEPDGKYYYLKDYNFEGDPLLRDRDINPSNPRGGTSGLLSLKENGSLLVGERDIILGKNVAGYD